MVKNQAKRNRKNKPTSKKYKFYSMDGEVIKREKICPRCGPGIFLAKTNNRLYCGKCHYTEFNTGEKKEEAKSEVKPEEKKE